MDVQQCSNIGKLYTDTSKINVIIHKGMVLG